VYQYQIHQQIKTISNSILSGNSVNDADFQARFNANAPEIHDLYQDLYANHKNGAAQFEHLLQSIVSAYQDRSTSFKAKDTEKATQNGWFLSNDLAGMSLYVDRFAGDIKGLEAKLDYFKELGINVLHLMPLFQSPPNESDGGYAVSDFRAIDKRFGTIDDLRALRAKMEQEGMYLLLDIVLNHTSHHHDWAQKAKAGDQAYQEYYYMFPDRTIPDLFDRTMPEVFPESSPGSFSYVKECDQYAMTVFHSYQWDLNFGNPAVLVAMMENIFFYANLGVDILRIDAPAFIWKQMGTTCQNLPEAHKLLRIIRLCVEIATPGMAILGEAIVAPTEIMKYFGTERFLARECDFAYNATQMALQWDALATADTRVMLAAQSEISQKPLGSSWITYTRCHDDIGLGYDDSMIASANYQPFAHRKYLKEYYSGTFKGSPAKGALFSVNPKTQDARISGTLAALCGLEKAQETNDAHAIDISIRKILLMQAQSIFLGGLPMLFYGDEQGYTNDYSFLADPGKSYDNRWMHRPIMDWKRAEKRKTTGSTEQIIFEGTRKLLTIRRLLNAIADRKNLIWATTHNPNVAMYVRYTPEQMVFCVFNFSPRPAPLTWYAFREHGFEPCALLDHMSGMEHTVGRNEHYLIVEPYGVHIFEMMA
jgi:amylosucrase